MLWCRAVRDGRRSTKAKAWREDPVEQDALLESIRAVRGRGLHQAQRAAFPRYVPQAGSAVTELMHSLRHSSCEAMQTSASSYGRSLAIITTDCCRLGAAKNTRWVHALEFFCVSILVI